MNSIKIESTRAEGHCITCRIGGLYVELMYNEHNKCIITTVNRKPMLPTAFELQYNCNTDFDDVITLRDEQETAGAVPTIPLKDIPLDFDGEGCIWSQPQGRTSLNGNYITATSVYYNTVEVPTAEEVAIVAMGTAFKAIGDTINAVNSVAAMLPTFRKFWY